MLPIKSYEPEKNNTIFEKGVTLLKYQMVLRKIIPLDLAYQRTLMYRYQVSIYKNVEYLNFSRRKFFPRGDPIKPVILEDRNRAHLIVN